MKELAWEIAETSQMMRRFYDRRAAALGVTTAQWRVIAHLGHSPGLKQVELAERLDVEPITACRIVDRLEGRGWSNGNATPRTAAPAVRLTDKAKPIYAKLGDLAEEMAAEAFEGFSLEEMEAARAKLARVRDNVSRAEAVLRKSA